MKVAVVANVRLPTEKAHGHALVKTAEGLADAGADVELWHPRRHQSDAALRSVVGQEILPFYGVPATAFRLRTLRNADVVRLERLPSPLYTTLFVLHELAWGLRTALRARRRGVDVGFTREVTVGLVFALLGVPVVVDVHMVPSGVRRRLLRPLGRLGRRVRFVALTEGNRAGLVAHGVPGARIVVAGSAVDLSAYDGLPSSDECRRLLGLPRDRPVLGYVGRFETFGVDKGIPQLLRAAAHLASTRDGPRPYVLCVGGPMGPVPGYRRLAGELGLRTDDVRFVDRVPAVDVPRWIRSLDVGFALYPRTKHMDEFASPLKILEYAAAGVPVVANDSPAMREALGDHRAALVGDDDPATVAEAVRRLLAAPVPTTPAASPLTWRRRAELVLDQAGALQVGR